MITAVEPRRIVAATLACGAEWYSGAGERYVIPSRKPNITLTNSMTASGTPGACSGSGRRIPFGCPVVPDEYSIAAPSRSSSTGVAGNFATVGS